MRISKRVWLEASTSLGPILLISAICLIVNYSIFDLNWPLWDGAIIDLAYDRGDLIGVKEMYYEAGGWHGFLYYSAFTVLGNPKTAQYIFTLFCLCSIGCSVYIICRESFRANCLVSIASSIIAVSFPANFVFSSSVMGFYAFCLMLFFASWALLFVCARRICFPLATIGIFISYSVGSLLCLNYAMLLLYILSRKPARLRIEMDVAILFLLPFAFFALKVLIMSPSGELYGAENYNAITIDFARNYQFARNFLRYIASIYWGSVTISVAIAILGSVYMAISIKNNGIKIKGLAIAMIPVLLLLVCAILPYSLVLKSPSFGWQARHAALVGPSLGLGLAYFYMRLEVSNNLCQLIAGTLSLLLVASLQFKQLSLGYGVLSNRVTLDRWLVEKLRSSIPQQGKKCAIVWSFSTSLRKDIGSFEYRFYELNGLTTMANKKSSFVNIVINGIAQQRERYVEQITSTYAYIIGFPGRQATYLIGDYPAGEKKFNCLYKADVDGMLGRSETYRVSFLKI